MIIAENRLGTSMLVAWMAVASSISAQETTPPFGTVVEVKRILTEVRVVDDSGLPIAGLGPGDFRVKIGGRRVEVESVLWIPVPEPRLIVVLFQTDIHFYRIKGLVRMAPQAADFVRNLEPTDRVAFFTFESHLELRSDFTADHEALAAMITTTEILGGTIDPPEPSSPLLGEHFDSGEARRAATLTRALEVVAQSLIPMPGPKILVLFGWGLGRYNAGHPITTGGKYYSAVAALAAARTSVFSLDITSNLQLLRACHRAAAEAETPLSDRRHGETPRCQGLRPLELRHRSVNRSLVIA